MNISDSLTSLIPALNNVRKEIPVIEKDAKNSYFKKKFASLSSILNIITPILCKNNLILTQLLTKKEEITYLVTYLYHTSGEYISSDYPLTELNEKYNFNIDLQNPIEYALKFPRTEVIDSQKFGSAITYARRYSILAILSITAGDEEDDGNKSSQTNSNQQKYASKIQVSTTASKAKNQIDKSRNAQIAMIRKTLEYPKELIEEWLQNLKKKTPSDLSNKEYYDLLFSICFTYASNNKIDVKEIRNAYEINVINLINKGKTDAEAIENWKAFVIAQTSSKNTQTK